MDSPRTLLEAIQHFSDPLNCFHYMVAKRWPSGEITCPTCGQSHVRFDQKRLVWTCNAKHPTVWMIANMKNGVSSHELARSLGVTQKSAWFMLHRIRLAMQSLGGGGLSGDVEADETFIGGKARNMHVGRRNAVRETRAKGRTHFGKTAVMGLLERHPEGSQVRLKVIPNVRRYHTSRFITKNVNPLSHVMTDSLRSYDNLTPTYVHDVVDHAEAYVLGNVHTNGLENFWSLLKRGLHGTYVSVEPFHLFRYLDEQAFRFNHRKSLTDRDRFSLVMHSVMGRRLTYQELIGEAKASKN